MAEGIENGVLVKFPGAGSEELYDYTDENTILIKRTVRSGQTVQYDGNVVVLGDINPGAEVIATGNIIVMGVLRGVVHAGAAGDEDAVVIAYRLRPTQLRISGHITRAPDDEEEVTQGPEIARIKDGVVTIEVFQTANSSREKYMT